MGAMLFKVYDIALNTVKRKQESRVIPFYCDTQLAGKTAAHTEMISITAFGAGTCNARAHRSSSGGASEIITVVQYALQ